MTMGIIAQGIQDYPISTTTVLAANASFTSDWRRFYYLPVSTDTEIPVTSPWADFIKGIAFADQTGTLNVEYSNDGTTVHAIESFTVGIGNTLSVSFNRRLFGTHVRLRYVNDGTLQGDFSLFAVLKSN